MSDQISLLKLNSLTSEQFVAALADIFEHSSWIPEGTWKDLPFESIQALHLSMIKVVKSATTKQQLKLLREHPQLAGKEASSGTLTQHSTHEQQSVGMNSLSSKEMQQIKTLNEDYNNKFGWPFIIAVLDNTKDDIFRKWSQRLENEYETELQNCLEQVYLIAKLRLDALFINS